MKKISLIMLAVLTVITFFSCSEDEMDVWAQAQKFKSEEGLGVDVVASRAYKGHNNELDSQAFTTAFKDKAGSRLDDCQLCHTGGKVVFEGGKEKFLDQCSYCHTYALGFEWKDVESGAPANYHETLNPYGKAYVEKRLKKVSAKNAENNVFSYAYTLKYEIGELDSDEDGYSNNEEISKGTYPGDAESNPSKKQAKLITLAYDDINSIATNNKHSQLMLMNANKQAHDEYVEYEGVTVEHLLQFLVKNGQLDLTGATGITVYCADAFTRTYPMNEITTDFPDNIWYAGLEFGATLLGENGFVDYPSQDILDDYTLADKQPIVGEYRLMLAYKRDGGQNLDTGTLDRASGKINGEGPFRVLIPQKEAGQPDRGKYTDKVGDVYDYNGDLDHNAGSCPKCIVAIRIDPKPDDIEDFDWKYAGYSYLQEKKLFIYGNGVK